MSTPKDNEKDTQQQQQQQHQQQHQRQPGGDGALGQLRGIPDFPPPTGSEQGGSGQGT